MTHGPWKGPSTIPNTGISTVTTEGRSQALDKSVDKLPPVMAGMDLDPAAEAEVIEAFTGAGLL